MGRMKKLWSIPIALGCIYAATILTQWGYDTYFNLGANFVDASVSGNTLYAYSLIQAIVQILGALHWWWPIIFVIVVVIAVASYFIFGNEGAAFWAILTIVAVLFLYGSPTMGKIIAQQKTDFLVPAPGCSVGPEAAYFVPDTYQGKAIFVPFDPATKKIGSGFFLKDLSALPCELEYKNIGPITK
jgi:hypothetical protein